MTTVIQVCDVTDALYALYTLQPGTLQTNTNSALCVMGMKSGS